MCDRKLAQTDQVAFLANHPALVQLADNNHGLLTRLAEVTGSPGLRKAPDSPGWIHFAAEHPSMLKFGSEPGIMQTTFPLQRSQPG